MFVACQPHAQTPAIASPNATAIVDAGEAPIIASERVRCRAEAVRIEIPKISSLRRCLHGWDECEGEVPVSIENCLSVEVRAEDVRLESVHALSVTASSEPWSPIAAGERATRAVRVHDAATYHAVVRVRVPPRTTQPGYTVLGAWSNEGTVENPVYLRAREACKACNGDWGRHGIMQREGCICRSRDFGKVCRDGDECDGDCLFQRVENLGHGLGRRVGKCSELVGDFGCVSYIAHGESKQPPHRLTAITRTERCVD